MGCLHQVPLLMSQGTPGKKRQKVLKSPRECRTPRKQGSLNQHDWCTHGGGGAGTQGLHSSTPHEVPEQQGKWTQGSPTNTEAITSCEYLQMSRWPQKTSSSVYLSHNDVLGFSFLVFVLFYCSCLLILTYFYFICIFFLFLPYRSCVNKLQLSVSVLYGILEYVSKWVSFFCLLLGSYPSVCFVQFQCVVRFCFILLYLLFPWN